LKGQPLTGFETVRLRKDGSPVDVRLSLAPLREANGKLSGTMGLLEDLTERRHTQEAGERLAAILEASSELVAIADPEGRVVYLNAGGRRMLGLPLEDEVVGRSITRFYASWAARQVVEEGFPAARRVGQWSGETALVDQAGEEIPRCSSSRRTAMLVASCSSSRRSCVTTARKRQPSARCSPGMSSWSASSTAAR
jgi:PAS domain S-box-containing protein